MFLQRSRNYAFGDWATGPRPEYFSHQTTNTTILQLQRSSAKDHVARQTILPQHFGGDDHIYEGPNAYRATLAAAAVVDNWRLWPGDEHPDYSLSVAHIGIWRIDTGVNDVIRIVEAGTARTATLSAGNYNGVTLATELKTAVEAAGASANTYTWLFNPITRLWNVLRASGSDAFGFNWTDALSTASALLGFTANDTGATTYNSDLATPRRTNPIYRMDEFVHHALTVVARCSVDGNLLRLRIIGLDEDLTIENYLNAEGRWVAAASSIDLRLTNQWRSMGRTFEGLANMKWWTYQISNGTAAAQVIDVGRVWIRDPLYLMSGEEVRP